MNKFRKLDSTDNILFIPFWYRVLTSPYFYIPTFLFLDLSVIGIIFEMRRTIHAREAVLELKKLVELQTTNVNLSKEILVKLQDLDNEINGRGIFFRSRSRRRKAFKALRKLAHQTLDKVPEKGFNKLQVRGGDFLQNKKLYEIIYMLEIDEDLCFSTIWRSTLKHSWHYLQNADIKDILLSKYKSKIRNGILYITRQALCHFLRKDAELLIRVNFRTLSGWKPLKFLNYFPEAKRELTLYFYQNHFPAIIGAAASLSGVLSVAFFYAALAVPHPYLSAVQAFLCLGSTLGTVALGAIMSLRLYLIGAAGSLSYVPLDPVQFYPNNQTIVRSLNEQLVVSVGNGYNFEKYMNREDILNSWQPPSYFNFQGVGRELNFNQSLNRQQQPLMLSPDEINTKKPRVGNITGLMTIINQNDDNGLHQVAIKKNFLARYENDIVTIKNIKGTDNKSFKFGKFAYQDITDLTVNPSNLKAYNSNLFRNLTEKDDTNSLRESFQNKTLLKIREAFGYQDFGNNDEF
jgi:hypothetical protein